MSTILDALNKYKKEKEQREGQPSSVPGGKYLDGDGGGGSPPQQPPGSGTPPPQGPGRRSLAMIVALIGAFLIIIVAAVAYLLFLINQQNVRISETAEMAQKAPAIVTLIVTPVPTPTPPPTPVPTLTPPPTLTPRPTPEPTPQQQTQPKDQFPATAATRHVEASELGFDISGIMWDIRNPGAIINGKIVGVGDVIDGYKIMKINRDSLEVSKGMILYKVQFEN